MHHGVAWDPATCAARCSAPRSRGSFIRLPRFAVLGWPIDTDLAAGVGEAWAGDADVELHLPSAATYYGKYRPERRRRREVGARLNRPGIEALYLSRHIETASVNINKTSP